MRTQHSRYAITRNLARSIPSSLRPSRPHSAVPHTKIRAAATMQSRHCPESKPPRPNAESQWKSLQLTHFLCVPIVTSSSRPVFEDAMKRFRQEAASIAAIQAAEAAAAGDPVAQANAETVSGLLATDARAVRPVGTLHMTLGVMSLQETGVSADDKEQKKTVQDAIDLLNKIDFNAMLHDHLPLAEAALGGEGEGKQPKGPRPLLVDLKGIRSLHSPNKTSFLYTAPEDPSCRLLPLCKKLKDAFVEEGLMVEQKTRDLVLHVTILNTVHARRDGQKGAPPISRDGSKSNTDAAAGGAGDKGLQTSSKDEAEPGNEEVAADHDNSAGEAESSDTGPAKKRSRRRKQGPIRFNASALLSHLSDFEWARNVSIERIAICRMGAEKVVGASGEVTDEQYVEVASRSI